jgi:hypothetical protein
MTKFIQTNTHSMVASSATESATLAPGERIPFNEELEAHKALAQQIEAEDDSVAHLSIVDVDLKAEKDQQAELEEKLAEAEEIAAEARNEQMRENQPEGVEDTDGIEGDTPPVPQLEGVDLPPQDEEAVRLAQESGAGQRASTQDDVVEEEGSSKPKAKAKAAAKRSSSK